MDVFIGYPGSCDNACVWENSPIYKAINSKQVKLAPNAIILGDSTYPLANFLMVPYRDDRQQQLNSDEEKFNYILNATRNSSIESFGILKQKFKILNYIDFDSLKFVSQVVMACVILHNFIINRGEVAEYIKDASANESAEDSETSDNVDVLLLEEDENDEAVYSRNNLTALFIS